MKAVIINKYGGNDVVEITEMPEPVPGPHDVLIRVRAAGINPVDWKIRSGMLKFFTGSRFPMVLGRECAGEIAGVGSRVTRFRKGDAVVAHPGIRSLGTYAQYVCSPEGTTFPKPHTVGFEEASTLPIAGLTALQSLRDLGRIVPGAKVLVNGASGGVGHFAVQIAKIFGAHVTGVCSGANADLVRGLGADRVIDYTSGDFVLTGDRYDIIFDAVAKRTFGECRKALLPGGVYVTTLPAAAVMLNQYLTGLFTAKQARTVMVKLNAADMDWMKTQIEAGRIRIVIDKAYPLDQVREAFAYSESGRAKGKVVLTVE